jgi:hypothetical protein
MGMSLASGKRKKSELLNRQTDEVEGKKDSKEEQMSQHARRKSPCRDNAR